MSRSKKEISTSEAGVAEVSQAGVLGPYVILMSNDILLADVMRCDEQGRVYVVGRTLGSQVYYLTRLLSEVGDVSGVAAVDLTFGTNGFVQLTAGEGTRITKVLQIIEVTPDHLTCSFSVSGLAGIYSQTVLGRFFIDGQIDTSYGVGGIAYFPQLPDSLLPAVSVTSQDARSNEFSLYGLLAAMSPVVRTPQNNTLPELQGAAPGAGQGGAALANGQIMLIASRVPASSDTTRSYLIKVNANGSLDSAFGGGVGYVRLSFGASLQGYRMALDSRDRTVIATDDCVRCLAARFLSEGEVDASFGQGGLVIITSPDESVNAPAVVIDGTGKIVITIVATDSSYVFKLDDNGAADPTFNNGLPVRLKVPGALYHLAEYVAVDEMQRVIVLGSYFASVVGNSTVVSRCTAQGLDTGFGNAGYFTFAGRSLAPGSLAIQAGLGILISTNSVIWRLTELP